MAHQNVKPKPKLPVQQLSILGKDSSLSKLIDYTPTFLSLGERILVIRYAQKYRMTFTTLPSYFK